MADGVFLLVDAAEGPLPQTRFVLRKAFEHKLKPVVVINKIDRPDARISEVHNLIFDLFLEMGADDATLEFPLIYSSGKQGIATTDMAVPAKDLKPLFDAILNHIPPPEADPDGPLQMQVVSLEYSDYVGRIAVGKINRGKIKKNQRVALIKQKDGSRVDDTVVQILEYDRLGKKETEQLAAGDICAVVGLDDADIGDTICDFDNPEALPAIAIDEPTLDMVFRINDSPFTGQEGKPPGRAENSAIPTRQGITTQRRHARCDPAKGATPSLCPAAACCTCRSCSKRCVAKTPNCAVGKPRVIIKEVDGVKMEPVEYLVIDVPASHVGPCMALVLRKASGRLHEDGRRRGTDPPPEFTIPARGLIGMRTRLMTATSGLAIVHHNFHEYQPVRPSLAGRANGVMIAGTKTGKATGAFSPSKACKNAASYL